MKPKQPEEVNDSLVGGMMAKLMEVIDGESRTEKWEVGRLKSAKKASVALPQEGATVAASLFTWQALDSANRASGCVLNDLSLDLAGCSPKGEWVMVAPVPVVFPRSGAGRPKKQKK